MASVTAGFGLSSADGVGPAPGSLRSPPSAEEEGISNWSLEPSVPISADIGVIVPASADPGSAGRTSLCTISIARLRRASRSSNSLSGSEGFALPAGAARDSGECSNAGAAPDITLLGRSADGSIHGPDEASLGGTGEGSDPLRPATEYQARLNVARIRFANAGAAGFSFWMVAAGEMGGAAPTMTGSAGVRPACPLNTRRSSTSPQAEHLKVWRSNPGTGAVSSPATCSRRISAPHDKHRIRPLGSNDKRAIKYCNDGTKPLQDRLSTGLSPRGSPAWLTKKAPAGALRDRTNDGRNPCRAHRPLSSKPRRPPRRHAGTASA
jgi:hypothetical protein